MPPRRTVVATVVAGLLLAVACERSTRDPLAPAAPSPSASSTVTTTSAAVTTPSTAVTSTTARPSPSSTTVVVVVPADPTAVLLAALRIEPEHLPGYDRDRFEHWIDADRDGCRTRCEVLEAERRSDLPGIVSGWFSEYDGFTTADPAQIEIDHVVALAEAWRSGAHAWDDARRQDFANDLDLPDALIAVSSSSNQSKADKDPAEWRPSRREAWCPWALGWLRTKVKWELSADEREVTALRQILDDCGPGLRG